MSEGLQSVAHKTPFNLPASAGSSSVEHFNGGHNDQATVEVDKNIAYFKLLGLKQVGSVFVAKNDFSVAVRLSLEGNVLTGQTLGDHQLVGVRRWEFDVQEGESGFLVTIETRAYERTRGLVNRVGAHLAGEAAQMAIWTAYLQNISDYYQETYNADELYIDSVRRYYGRLRNPWRPDDE